MLPDQHLGFCPLWTLQKRAPQMSKGRSIKQILSFSGCGHTERVKPASTPATSLAMVGSPNPGASAPGLAFVFGSEVLSRRVGWLFLPFCWLLRGVKTPHRASAPAASQRFWGSQLFDGQVKAVSSIRSFHDSAEEGAPNAKRKGALLSKLIAM